MSRKLFCLAMSLAFVFATVACGKQTDKPNADATNPRSTLDVQPTSEPESEQIETGGEVAAPEETPEAAEPIAETSPKPTDEPIEIPEKPSPPATDAETSDAPAAKEAVTAPVKDPGEPESAEPTVTAKPAPAEGGTSATQEPEAAEPEAAEPEAAEPEAAEPEAAEPEAAEPEAAEPEAAEPEAAEPEAEGATAETTDGPVEVKNPPTVDAEKSGKIFEVAREKIEKGKLEEATALMEEWLAMQPLDHVNRRNLVHIYLKLKQYDKAATHLKLLVSEFPQRMDLWGHLGRAQAQLGDHTDAVASLSIAMKKMFRDVDLALDLAREQVKIQRYSDAIATLDAVLQQGERVGELLEEKGNILAMMGEYKEAYKTYKQLQQIRPRYDIAIIMAKIAERFDRCDDIIDSLAGFQQNFEGPEAYLLLAKCSMKKGRLDEAQVLLAASLKNNSNCFECALKLADTYFLKENWKLAIQFYTKAAGLDPKDYRSFHQLGKAYANQGDHFKAAQAFASANERRPKDPEILYGWGVESVRAGERGLAWQIWGELDRMDKEKAKELGRLIRQ